MSEPTQITFLTELAVIDSRIFTANAVLQKHKKEAQAKELLVQKAKQELVAAEQVVNEKKSKYTKLEKTLKEENEKIAARKKQLASFSNYKLQQGALREIDHSAKELTLLEETMLSILGEIETEEQNVSQLKEKFHTEEEAFKKLHAALQDKFEEMQNDISRNMKKREEALNDIEEKNLKLYENVKQKYGFNPVVPIQNNSCSGCNMALSPKIVNDTLAGKSIMQCPGCRRILYLKQESS
jgi:uncharacterized protein